MKPMLYLLLSAVLLSAGQVAIADDAVAPVPAVPTFEKSDPAKYGEQIAYYIDSFDSGWVDSYAKAELSIISASGERSASQINVLIKEEKGGNKNLIRYLDPATVRGVAAVTHEHHDSTDESWLYLPSTRRVRRISGANRTSSFQGTEFTYEDIARVVPSRYQWKFLKTVKEGGQELLVVEGRPTYKDSGYAKLDCYFNPTHWRVERIDFYDKASRLLKTLTASDWKRYHNRYWRPNKLAMVNVQTKRQSELIAQSQLVNLALYKKKDGTAQAPLQSDLFTRAALEPR